MCPIVPAREPVIPSGCVQPDRMGTTAGRSVCVSVAFSLGVEAAHLGEQLHDAELLL
jgi:hypothetical protein